MVAEEPVVVIREFDAGRDCPGVAAVERVCEVGSSGGGGKLALLTDLLGDPICRVRHSPAFLMLVAETGPPEEREIVGVVRGCVKTVTCGKRTPRDGNPPAALCTKVAYLLGLRVSPPHRRMGVGLRLVRQMEDWFREKGAEYSYMATDKDNEASLRLFTGRCGYSKFRTPSILVQPVFAHRLRLPRRCTVLRLPPSDAEPLYRRRFSTVEFFPRDIDAVLAVETHHVWKGTDLFRPFGLYFLYGVGGEGPAAARLLRGLCAHAHNMARRGGCGVVAAEVAAGEPLRAGIPHWRRLSCAEDLWCMKRLDGDYSDGAVGDWTKAPPGPSIFVDPREI